MPVIRLILLVVFVLSIVFPVWAIDIHVSPTGDDAAAGSPKEPLKSMAGAQHYIRKLKTSGMFSEDIRVIFHQGDYYLSSPVYFGIEDGGTAALSVTYQAAAGEKVNFIGAEMISGFEANENGMYQTQVKGSQFEQLYVNGKRAVRARTPDQGKFFDVVDVEETIFEGAEERVPTFAMQEVFVNPMDAQSLNLSENLQEEDVLAVFYHKWDNTRKFIQHYNAETNSFYFSGGGMKPWNPINESSRFYVENLKSGLDAPGEWYLDTDGTLYYIPREGEDMEKALVYAPVTERLLVIQGESAEHKVENLHFKNLNFLYGGYQTPRSGNEPAQAAAPIPALIMVDWADGISIEGCEIAHTGVGGIWFRNGVSNGIIRKNYIHDLGAGGVKIGPFAAGTSPSLEDRVSGFNLVENNIIRNGGWVFPCAVGAMIFHAHDNSLVHNEIADFRYSGVSVGWVWGYSHSFAKRNTVKYNHIHHLGWGDLSDMGGVYTLGPSEGTVVSHNHIHHIYSMTYGGWGLYTDEGSTGIVMENNLVYACKNAGFHQHYGKENVINNNILAYNRISQLQATRVEDHLSFTFSNNIVLYDRGSLLSSNWENIRLESDHNLYWDERGGVPDFGSLDWEAWQKKGHDKHSVNRAPGFTDPKNFDFTFKDETTVNDIRFEPFDYKKAGVYGDPAWVKLAGFDPDRARKFDALVVRLSSP
ncbi:right-handed parallel beta-helix repeat-containing protein [Cyclobacterium sp. SYSU L10401]|uniref:right-handed parallel beta-helix repeat-containing protein n=1 Tax=Cyclobacterium sp. SYSU L10401 TaxID=2678657 RepID=UPI0013D37B47|nr:right-handed parallel beta-helix repeat-containing protein [Cyclobacterium sp. SYSU L10401]